jgi:hypothetical protein
MLWHRFLCYFAAALSGHCPGPTVAGAAAVEPIAILRQPQSVEVPAGSLVRLSVEAAGDVESYTWLDDLGHVVSAGPSARELELINVVSTRPIGYHVSLSNATTTVTSEVATVFYRLTRPELLWKGRVFTKVAEDGTRVPGTTSNLFSLQAPPAGFPNPLTSSLKYRDGTLIFAAQTTAGSHGLFRWRQGNLQTLAIPDSGPSLGDVQYASEEGNGVASFSTAAALKSWSPSGVETLLDDTVPAPERSEFFAEFGPCARRGNGVAFLAFLRPPTAMYASGIYFHDGSTLRRIVDDTTDLPGLAGPFQPVNLNPPVETFVNYDGHCIVFSSRGGFYKSTITGVITKLADQGDLLPGSANHFINFGQIDVDGGLIFASSAGKIYTFDEVGAINLIHDFGAILSAAGPRMAYFYQNGPALFYWNDGAKEQIVFTSRAVGGKSVLGVSELDGQGDDLALLLTFADFSHGIYLASGPPPATLSPVILADPLDINVVDMGTASFAVTAVGGPPLAYQWRRDGAELPLATNTTLNIGIASTESVGAYSVVVSNAYGAATSGVARLSVTTPFGLWVAPRPALMSSADYRSNLTMLVRASGPNPLSYQWKKGTSEIAGATGPSYTITNLTEGDRDLYQVSVSDGTTNAISELQLDSIRPIIIQQPQGLTNVAGSSAVFRVTALGVPPLTYQWTRSWQNVRQTIPGATNAILVLTNVLEADAGEYSVEVQSEGSVFERRTSDFATLTVLSADPPRAPKFEDMVYLTNTLQVRLLTETGRTYEIQFAPSLAPPSWTVLQTMPSNGSNLWLMLPAATSQGYYRAKVVPELK